jgi:hypothetical protein
VAVAKDAYELGFIDGLRHERARGDAPELLWGLKAAIAALESHPEGDNRSDEDIARMNAAIAAAEARS